MKTPNATERPPRFNNSSPALFKSIMRCFSASSLRSQSTSVSESPYSSLSTASSCTKLAVCTTPQNISETPTNTQYGLLSKDNSDEWQITLEDGLFQFPFSGPYDFVTMTNGEIRVKFNPEHRTPSHLDLSGGLEHVISAGQLFFSETGSRELLWWNKESEDYPSDTIHDDVGLPIDAYEEPAERLSAMSDTLSLGGLRK